MKRLLSVLMLVVLVLSPVAVFAQTEEPTEWETFTTDDGLLSVSVPPEWLVEEAGEDIPFPGIVVVNSEDTLAAWNDPESMGPGAGQVALLTMVIPRDFFRAIGSPLPEDASIVDLTNLLGAFFSTPEGEAPPEGGVTATEEAMAEPVGTAEAELGAPMLGEAEEIELGASGIGGYVTYQDVTGQAVYFVRDMGEGLLGIVIALTAPEDEFTEEYMDLAAQVLGSLAYAGTVEDIMSAFMAPETDVEEGEATLSGEELLQERCTVCHDLARVTSQDKDEAGWIATVDRMISYGAQLNAGEREALIEYLVATH